MKLYSTHVCFVLLFFSVATVFLSCASTPAPSPPPATVVAPVAKPPRVEELELPEHPYISQSEMVLYVAHKNIIEMLSKLLGLAHTPFLSLIESVHASFTKKDAVVALRIGAITFMRKKKILKSARAVSLDTNERYWRYEDEHGTISYFDIGYKNAIVMLSFNPMSVEAPVWGWSPHEYIIAQQDKKPDAWLWSTNPENIQEYEIEGFAVHALGVIVLNYSSDVNSDIKTTFMFEYSGERSARTTLRLLIPRLLESIDTSTNFSSLPNIVFLENVLILEGLIVSSRVFWKHVNAIIKIAEER